ncbi:MAG: helix-turn-helix domain-containing protein [Bacilli bacterium]|nr:helix-turn-helix domain-containing protein [Bacilli bacterium]
MEINLGQNIRYLREKKGIDQQKLADILEVPRSTLACWENNIRTPKLEQIVKIAEYFNTNLDIIYSNFDNAIPIELDDNTVNIPVLGVIKAGIPIEAQQDIIEYIEIPKRWTLGGRKFYGLKISGDSMYPKYDENDIVIFEQLEDMSIANNKDCAVMVNGDDATFKKVLVNEQGIVLVPYNMAYDMMMFSPQDVIDKPVRIIGIAKEKRTKLD